MKQEYIEICECKKDIKGFSEHHLKKNLEIHKKLSIEHKERLKLMKKHKDVIYTFGLSKNKIVEILSNHPVMIEDLKEIGRNYEKKILVS